MTPFTSFIAHCEPHFFHEKKNIPVKQFSKNLYVHTSFTCLIIFLVSDFSVKSWSDRLIVNRLKKSRTFPNSKQWAAVTTHWFEIKDPPQKWSPENKFNLAEKLKKKMMANGQTWELQRCHPRIFTDFRFRSINNFQQNRFISDIIWNSINSTFFLTKFWFTKCISGSEWRKKCLTSHFFPGYLLPRNQIWTSSLNSGFFNTFFDFLFSF